MWQCTIENDVHRIIEVSLLGVGADRKLLDGFTNELGTSQNQRLLSFLAVSSLGLTRTLRLWLVTKFFFGFFAVFLDTFLAFLLAVFFSTLPAFAFFLELLEVFFRAAIGFSGVQMLEL